MSRYIAFRTWRGLLEMELRTRGDMLLSGNVVVSLAKGGRFKVIIRMKTVLKVDLCASKGKVFAKTSVGIWEHQIVPMAIMWLWFWLIFLTQILGLVQQSRLDTRVMEVLAKAAENEPALRNTSPNYSYIPHFCSECGKPVTGNFCATCGAKV